MTMAHMDLTKFPYSELDDFWDAVLLDPSKPHVDYWAGMKRDDPKVQEVLARIQLSIVHAHKVMIGEE